MSRYTRLKATPLMRKLFTSQSGMKHPNKSSETFGFNLGQADKLRCVSTGVTVCGTCEACMLLNQLTCVRDWFLKAGNRSRRRFVLGLVCRLQSVNLLEYCVSILSPLFGKDYTYSRSRTHPSLVTDRGTMSADRACNTLELEREILRSWQWFEVSNYWTKSNFLMAMLKSCEAHLLYLVGVQAKTLLLTEKKVYVPPDNYEASSISDSQHSFDSIHNPDLHLLRASSIAYSVVDHQQFTPTRSESKLYVSPRSPTSQKSLKSESSKTTRDLTDANKSEISCMHNSPRRSLDLTHLMPMSVEAHAGISQYKDFIRWLPVHLSKLILGMLDQGCLRSCLTVSKNWRPLVTQVHHEYFVQQRLLEDVMLLQGNSGQGRNPVYANDIDVVVPVIESNSFKACSIDISNSQISSKSEFPSESHRATMANAYNGYVTRKIIIEERNVYCGAYNVMVVVDRSDPHRVFHTDGNKWMALGCSDRKVRFINMDSGREEGPVISGHAGSVYCVGLCQKNGYVLSGSYDTSIRCWSLETGKCLKIYRGHRDTVLCMQINGDTFATGGKDKLCKVWEVTTGKCLHTFTHRHAVVSVALGDKLCISGCEGSKVMVWHLATGQHIKTLTGHHKSVVSIKFDDWHIITASKDCYAMAWSACGDHQRCLSALKHPREVLCMEFMYLRVITGCADGKLRVWNMITGDCLRIMRGNSHCDPITSLIATPNRLVLNTPNNLLVMNFEPIEYDYTLTTDKIPSLLQYCQFSDAPIRQMPYSRIRAKRMARAGATNMKIIHHSDKESQKRDASASTQLAHSAKILSRNRMQHAKAVQSRALPPHSPMCSPQVHSVTHKDEIDYKQSISSSKSRSSAGSHRTKGTSSRAAKRNSVKKDITQISVAAEDDVLDSDLPPEDVDQQRRVSWSFQQVLLPNAKEMNLSETKSLLRSQIRSKEVTQPDFIYLALSNIQAQNKVINSKDEVVDDEDQTDGKKKSPIRPVSSPSRFDTRLRYAANQKSDSFYGSNSPNEERKSIPYEQAASTEAERVSSAMNEQTVYKRDFKVTPLCPADKDFVSMHSQKLKSSIPKGQVIRPHTAVAYSSRTTTLVKPIRPKSAGHGLMRRLTKAATALAMPAQHSPMAEVKKQQQISTSAAPPAMVPMLMYPHKINENLDRLKIQRKERIKKANQGVPGQQGVGAVSEFTNPFRENNDISLLTHVQVQQEVDNIDRMHIEQQKKVKDDQERRQKRMWLNKIKKLNAL